MIKLTKKTKIVGSKGFAVKEVGINKDGGLFISLSPPNKVMMNRNMELRCAFNHTDDHTVLIEWATIVEQAKAK